jgi:methionyl-tRNA formyltransferase
MTAIPRTAFMGTPEFAVPCLQALIDAGYPIVGVYCQPDKPVGRKQVLTAPPVKVHAEQAGLPVFQPTKMRDGAVAAQMQELGVELIVVVAYGRILPAAILDVPRYKPLNVHGSLLPKYRGAAPIQWAIANQEAETGVTVMIMEEGLDTGPMLRKASLPIGPEDTSESLFPKLSKLGADLLIATLPDWIAGVITPEAQDDSQHTLAPIIEKNQGLIEWTASAAAIDARRRAFTPWPGVHTFFREQPLKLLQTQPLTTQPPELSQPGDVVAVGNDYLDVVCGEGAERSLLRLLQVQLPGGKPIGAGDFVRGQRVAVGERLLATILC